MLLSEIKNKLDNGTFDCKEIEVKSYLPIVSKTVMILGYDKDNGEHVDGIVNECIEFDTNGTAYVNYFKKEMSLLCSIINWYTNIESDDIDIEDTIYDFYITSYIWETVKKSIGNEINIIMEFLDKSIDEELRKYNSIESVLANGLTKIINKLPNDKQIKALSKSLVKDVSKLDWDKVPMIKEMFKTAKGEK